MFKFGMPFVALALMWPLVAFLFLLTGGSSPASAEPAIFPLAIELVGTLAPTSSRILCFNRSNRFFFSIVDLI